MQVCWFTPLIFFWKFYKSFQNRFTPQILSVQGQTQIKNNFNLVNQWHSLRQSDIVDYRAAYFAAKKFPPFMSREDLIIFPCLITDNRVEKHNCVQACDYIFVKVCDNNVTVLCWIRVLRVQSVRVMIQYPAIKHDPCSPDTGRDLSCVL